MFPFQDLPKVEKGSAVAETPSAACHEDEIRPTRGFYYKQDTFSDEYVAALEEDLATLDLE